AALSHSSSLRYQIGEDAEVRGQYQRYHPKRLAPAGDIVASEQIAIDHHKQPKPDDECEDRKRVHQEIRKRKTSVKEHDNASVLIPLATRFLTQSGRQSNWTKVPSGSEFVRIDGRGSANDRTSRIGEHDRTASLDDGGALRSHDVGAQVELAR